MDLELNNSWEYEDEDWWEWSAYLTGKDLDKVEHVEYILHPTFKNPVRKVTDPSNGFRLDTAGWGTFKLKAIAHLTGGGQQLLTHEIRLESQPKRGRTESTSKQ